ncbi:MAG TPA: prepilin-type N-terminal cleavage/methylation domain-containing protein [Polyangiaceae bacterium]|nr:prepilin-type N-terminal cleavage/methylation domain-containing protein [Polyangiaceae bacterium]
MTHCSGLKRKYRSRGFTLIEMMIVIAIIALLSAGIAVGAYDIWKDARKDSAQTDTNTMRHSVSGWLLKNPSEVCPTPEMLISDGIVDEDSARADPWGGPWRISCEEGRITVTSNGPDKLPNTADDIQSPRKRP